MKLTTESYDALGTLLPAEELEVVSTFFCDFGLDNIFEPIVLGIWVQHPLSNNVEPRYLTEAQRDQLAQS